MTGETSAALDAATVLALFAVDPEGTGLVLRSRAGPVRDACLALLRRLDPERRQRRLPAGIGDARLLGGLDLEATLRAGRPVAARGLLGDADGGILVLPMAERIEPSLVGRLAAVLDDGAVRLERDGLAAVLPTRFGLLALDEGDDDERPPAALLDRLALRIDLDGLSHRDDIPDLATAADIAAARRRLAGVAVSEEALTALAAAAVELGIASLRAPLFALAVARAAAALDGREAVGEADAVLAARLVLAPRATRLPAGDTPEAPPPDGAEAPPPEPPADGGALDDVVLAAAVAAMPPGLLARIAAGAGGRQSGRGAAVRLAGGRGRPSGSSRGLPRGGARLDLVETLRAAVPWQALRRREAAAAGRPARRIEVRGDDFRVSRLKQKTRTTTIFAVDASGFAAFRRLAEAKGAVELLLAECYVRRDQVALLAFRGRGAELLLPPTRSLVRAKRSLADLPGGGGTPLAAGIDAGAALAEAVGRRGERPVLVILSDGRANVARDGIAARARAEEEALAAARRLGGQEVTVLFVDIGPRPEPAAERLAAAMGARYLPLPRADAGSLSAVVRAAAS